MENWFEQGTTRSLSKGQIYKSEISCGYILRGMEEMMPTFDDVYVVSMINHWCGKHLLEAVVVPLIYTGLVVARPWNLQT